MNLVDAILVALAMGAIVHGIALGAAVQVISFGGLVSGLALSVAAAPHVQTLASDSTTRVVLVVATLVLVPAMTTAVARVLGVRAWLLVQHTKLGAVDAGVGAVIAAVAALLTAWLIASMLARLPDPTLTTEIQQSRILRTIDSVMPAPPAIFARIGRLLNPLGFPDVFAQLEPTPPGGLTVAAPPLVRAALARDGASVLKIEGSGCGGILEGSGLVVAPDLVLTNAHVVAGISHPFVVEGQTRRPATAVLFDPKLDVAVLRADGLRATALTVTTSSAPRGTSAVVIGYPGGGPLTAVGAAVLTRNDAVGRDIYGRSLTTRTIYQLRAVVRPGNSGGPLVLSDGTVVGVVFARSSSNPDVGYALTSDEVMQRIQPALQNPTPTSTEGCAA